MVAPLLDGEAFEEEEAFAVEDVVAEGVEEVTELGKGEFGLKRDVSGDDGIDRWWRDSLPW